MDLRNSLVEISVRFPNNKLRHFLGFSLLLLNSAFCFFYFDKFHMAVKFIFFVQPTFYPPFLLFFINYLYSIGLTFLFLFFHGFTKSPSFEKIIRIMSYSCSIGFLLFFFLAYFFFTLLNPYRTDNSIEKVVKLPELILELKSPKILINLYNEPFLRSRKYSETLKNETFENLMKNRDFRSYLCHLIRTPFGATIGFPFYSIIIWTLFFYLVKNE